MTDSGCFPISHSECKIQSHLEVWNYIILQHWYYSYFRDAGTESQRALLVSLGWHSKPWESGHWIESGKSVTVIPYLEQFDEYHLLWCTGVDRMSLKLSVPHLPCDWRVVVQEVGILRGNCVCGYLLLCTGHQKPRPLGTGPQHSQPPQGSSW